MHDWLDKLKILVNQEASFRRDGTEASLNQAKTCANLINLIRTKYGFTQEILPDLGDSRPDLREYVFTADSKMFRTKAVVWEEIMLAAVAGFFGVTPIYNNHTNLKSVVGEEKPRRRTIKAYMQLYRQMDRAAGQFVRESVAALKEFEAESPAAAELENWRDSYLQGVADGIDSAFAEIEVLRKRIAAEKRATDDDRPQLAAASAETVKPPRGLLLPAPPEIEKELNDFYAEQGAQSPAGQPQTGSQQPVEASAADDEMMLDEESYNVGLQFSEEMTLPAAFVKVRDELTGELNLLLRKKRDRELRRKRDEMRRARAVGNKNRGLVGTAEQDENQLFLDFWN